MSKFTLVSLRVSKNPGIDFSLDTHGMFLYLLFFGLTIRYNTKLCFVDDTEDDSSCNFIIQFSKKWGLWTRKKGNAYGISLGYIGFMFCINKYIASVIEKDNVIYMLHKK